MSTISSGINSPAKHAVIRHTTAPATKALKITLFTFSDLFGINVASAETMIPIEAGLENPQIA